MPWAERRYSFHKGSNSDNALDFSKRSSFIRDILLEKVYPNRIVLPMQMNFGVPAVPTVEVGESVTIGQCVGAPRPGSFAVPVHSGISGTVKEIRDITLPNGIRCPAVVIESDRKRTFHSSVYPRQDVNVSASKVRGIVKDAGIVGMGGEGIPTIAKINRARNLGVNRILVNCLQNEPFANCDHMRICETPEYIVMGAVALAGAVGVSRIDFLISESRKDDLAALQNAMELSAGDYSGYAFNIKFFKERFPQGYYGMVAKALYDVDLQEDETLESRCGAVMFNCSTVYACWEAIADNLPLTSRIVTVTGANFESHNVIAPIGTTVSDLLATVNGISRSNNRIIWGNCLTGLEITDPENTPITKTTSAVSVIPKKEIPVSSCIKCLKCTETCPEELEPGFLYDLIRRGITNRAEDEGARKCIACGICSYICPSGIDLTGAIASFAASLKGREKGKAFYAYSNAGKIDLGGISLLEVYEEEETEEQVTESDGFVLPFEGGKPV